MSTGVHLVGRYLASRPNTIDDLAPGEAAVLNMDGESVAVFKDDHSEVHAVSAVCTHLYCPWAEPRRPHLGLLVPWLAICGRRRRPAWARDHAPRTEVRPPSLATAAAPWPSPAIDPRWVTSRVVVWELWVGDLPQRPPVGGGRPAIRSGRSRGISGRVGLRPATPTGDRHDDHRQHRPSRASGEECRR